jgi:YidC/Oxa1 family membrane protein insertase
MMEKRVLLAALLSALFLSVYSQVVLKRYGPQPGAQRPAPLQTQPNAVSQQSLPETRMVPVDAFHTDEKEETISLESSQLSLEIGASSGAIRKAALKKFLDRVGGRPLTFGGEVPVFGILVGDEPISWKVVEQSDRKVTLESVNPTNDYHISYNLNSDNNLIDIELDAANPLKNGTGDNVAIVNSWSKADETNSRYNQLELVLLLKKNGKEQVHRRYFAKSNGRKNVPRGTFLASLSERYFCQTVKPIGGSLDVVLLPSKNGSIVTESRPNSEGGESDRGRKIRFQVYIGPRDYFYLKAAGLEEAFPIGILGQIGLILLMVLRWIAGITHNYGLAILAFSTMITCMMAPFTMLGFRSMRKMQELKPKIDRIMAQNKEDPKRANQEIFALYKENRVSPLSGCLPMLLQVPIFIALFQALSQFIDLRGKEFLWIKDLSLPDRLAPLPFSVPVLGRDLNVLPIIMAVAMYFQTKLSQANIPTDQGNPTAKMMSGPMMPILFGVMFYQVPSGLVLYWLTNTLISLLWYKQAVARA